MIRYVDSTHQYFLNDVEIPSVSKLLSTVLFTNKYDSVDKITLENAAKFGKNVHKAIETGFDLFLTNEEQDVYDRYLDLISKEDIKPTLHEQIVYTNDYAGTLDMIGFVKNILCMLDVKTTYKLDIEYLSWQLSLYEYAYGRKFNKLYAIWLPKKGKAKLVEIERKTVEEINWLTEKYKEVTR